MEQQELAEFLEAKVIEYNRSSFIESDPVLIPHLFTKKEDIEIAGFFAATIAWGQRPVIIRNARRWMELMDMAPYDFVTGASPKELKRLDNFVHRTFNSIDAQTFVLALRTMYKKHGGMEKVFAEGLKINHGGTGARGKILKVNHGDTGTRGKILKVNHGDTGTRGKIADDLRDAVSPWLIKNAILHFRTVFFSVKHEPRTEKHVANPAAGSNAKRINMFLRWMVRCDRAGVDFGTWKSISPSLLCCPLDVHVGNVARALGLLERKQDDWKAVEELTARLRALDPEDPAKYDFALFGLGIFESFGGKKR